MVRRFLILLAFALSNLASGAALAQSSNRPYLPSSSVGLSIAARQVILNAEIRGVRPDAIVRGRDGFLVNVVRFENLALVQTDADSFLPGQRPHAGWATGLSTGLGWGLPRYTRGSYLPSPESSRALNAWISGNFAAVPYGEGTPIDIWIQQLSQI